MSHLTPSTPPRQQLQISTIRAHICQVEHVICMLQFILADQLADLPPYQTKMNTTTPNLADLLADYYC